MIFSKSHSPFCSIRVQNHLSLSFRKIEGGGGDQGTPLNVKLINSDFETPWRWLTVVWRENCRRLQISKKVFEHRNLFFEEMCCICNEKISEKCLGVNHGYNVRGEWPVIPGRALTMTDTVWVLSLRGEQGWIYKMLNSGDFQFCVTYSFTNRFSNY